MSKLFPRIGEASTVASGDSIIGQVDRDKDGNLYQFVLNAGAVAIVDGAPCQFKTAGECPSGVIVSAAASGVGTVVAGVAVIGLEADTQAEAGETFWVLIDGIHENGLHSSAAIVAADPVTVSSSGTIVEADAGLTQMAPGAVVLGKALEADIWTADTAASGGLRLRVKL